MGIPFSWVRLTMLCPRHVHCWATQAVQLPLGALAGRSLSEHAQRHSDRRRNERRREMGVVFIQISTLFIHKLLKKKTDSCHLPQLDSMFNKQNIPLSPLIFSASVSPSHEPRTAPVAALCFTPRPPLSVPRFLGRSRLVGWNRG